MRFTIFPTLIFLSILGTAFGEEASIEATPFLSYTPGYETGRGIGLNYYRNEMNGVDYNARVLYSSRTLTATASGENAFLIMLGSGYRLENSVLTPSIDFFVGAGYESVGSSGFKVAIDLGSDLKLSRSLSEKIKVNIFTDPSVLAGRFFCPVGLGFGYVL